MKSFQGPASAGQVIKVQGPAKTGKYVLVQMNNSPDCLSLNEVEVFGCVVTGKAGAYWSPSYPKNSPQVKLTHSWSASSPCLAFSSCFWSSKPSELSASSARPGLKLLPSKRTSILCTELTTKLKLLKRMTKGFLTLKPMTIWESRNFLITWACLLYWLYCISQFYSFLVYLCKSP